MGPTHLSFSFPFLFFSPLIPFTPSTRAPPLLRRSCSPPAPPSPPPPASPPPPPLRHGSASTDPGGSERRRQRPGSPAPWRRTAPRGARSPADPPLRRAWRSSSGPSSSPPSADEFDLWLYHGEIQHSWPELPVLPLLRRRSGSSLAGGGGFPLLAVVASVCSLAPFLCVRGRRPVARARRRRGDGGRTRRRPAAASAGGWDGAGARGPASMSVRPGRTGRRLIWRRRGRTRRCRRLYRPPLQQKKRQMATPPTTVSRRGRGPFTGTSADSLSISRWIKTPASPNMICRTANTGNPTNLGWAAIASSHHRQ
jgi:hypothetical protein